MSETQAKPTAQTISKENLPAVLPPVGEWETFRKTAITRAVRMEGPFLVETSEGPLTCEDGWVALDARGYPYPIADEEFRLIYEPAGELSEELWAIPGVSTETGEAAVALTWGTMSGQLDPDAARLLGLAIVEAAETADVEGLLFGWLLEDSNGSREGVARILEGFRTYRTRQAAEVEDRSA